MNQKKIISIYIIFIISLLLLPYFSWAKNYSLDILKFTEEWYKFIANLVLLLFGYLIFDLLLKNSEKRKSKSIAVKLINDLLSIEKKIRINIKENNIPNLKRNLFDFSNILNYIRNNSINFIDNKDIMNYLNLYDSNISSSVRMLLNTDVNIDETIKSKILLAIDNYFTEINSASNNLYS